MKIERWVVVGDEDYEKGLWTTKEKSRFERFEYERVYLIDADKEDRKVCENCIFYHPFFCGHEEVRLMVDPYYKKHEGEWRSKSSVLLVPPDFYCKFFEDKEQGK